MFFCVAFIPHCIVLLFVFSLNLNSFEFEFKLNVFESFSKMENLSLFPYPFQPSRPISSFSFFFLSSYRGPNSLSAQPFPFPGPSPHWPVPRLPSLPSHCQWAPPIGCFFLPCASRTLAKPESGPATSSPALALTPRRPAAPIKRTARTPLDPERKSPPPRLPKP